MKTRLIVSAVIKKDDSVLFVKKPENIGPYPNTWHIPGGGVEENETLEDAIKREIKEETNLEVTNLKPLMFLDDVEPDKHGEQTHYVFLIYTANWQSGTTRSGDDITQFEWIQVDKIKEIAVPRPSVEVFKQLSYI